VGQRFLSKCVQAHHDTTIVLWCTYTHQFLSLDETKTWTDCWVLSRNLLFPTIPSFRWGWVFLEQMWILSWIQFTTHSIEIVVVETKQFVGSFENAILTQQTCGQRSNRVAESKCRSLGNDFSEWICYVFLMSKCRGDWDYICALFVHLRKEKRCAMATSGKKRVSPAGKIGIWHCAALSACYTPLCTPGAGPPWPCTWPAEFQDSLMGPKWLIGFSSNKKERQKNKESWIFVPMAAPLGFLFWMQRSN